MKPLLDPHRCSRPRPDDLASRQRRRIARRPPKPRATRRRRGQGSGTRGEKQGTGSPRRRKQTPGRAPHRRHQRDARRNHPAEDGARIHHRKTRARDRQTPGRPPGRTRQTEAEKEKLAEEGELSKARAEKLANDLKAVQTEAALEITRLQNDIARIETADKRAQFADAKPVFLKNPLKENGILVISDRRIPLNGLITTSTADFITSRIQYWNNKDRELPIFIVIDASPGGSVMAGYRILKAMESSDAPVHVVVKSFAASMAAAITTLAKESYAYPNAVILHHQISSVVMGQLNLTQQREFHEESQRWWARLGTPVANKMGITPDEFIKKMYAHSSSGDWSEFGEQAQGTQVGEPHRQGIDETSVHQGSGHRRTRRKPPNPSTLAEEVDASGKPFVWLPRLESQGRLFPLQFRTVTTGCR